MGMRGDIAAELLNSLMLDPILTLLEEPVDPSVVLLADHIVPPIEVYRPPVVTEIEDIEEPISPGTIVPDTFDTGSVISEATSDDDDLDFMELHFPDLDYTTSDHETC